MMEQQMLVMKLAKLLIICIMPIILMVSAKVSEAASCQNRVDLAIAVDTTSSLSSSSFDQVKAEVKGIVSAFKVGPDNIRLALISMSQRASVQVNFNAVNSLSDFNAAVDRLTLSTDIVDLSEGIRVAKESVFSTARTGLTSKSLILVKDRRPGSSTVSEAAVLSRVTSETAAVKALGAAVNAVGVGGLWNRAELTALFGNDFLLFMGKMSALGSVKSLNNVACVAACPNRAASSQRLGACFGSHRFSVSATVDLAVNSTGGSVCRKTISKGVLPCDGTSSRCYKYKHRFETCPSPRYKHTGDIMQGFGPTSQLKVSLVHNFVPRLERCIATRIPTADSCGFDRTQYCQNRAVDLMLLLDMTGGPTHEKAQEWRRLSLKLAGMLLAKTKPGQSRIGVVACGSQFCLVEPFAFSDRPVSVAIDTFVLRRQLMGAAHGRPVTHKGLSHAVDAFRHQGRTSDVHRFAILLTDAHSVDPVKTMENAMLAKLAGITVVPLGVGDKVSASELRDLASPDVDPLETAFPSYAALGSFLDATFIPKFCTGLADPPDTLCQDGVLLQTVSRCLAGTQHLTRVSYLFDSAKSCRKSVISGAALFCQKNCIDPINGNEYNWRSRWTNVCLDFVCGGQSSSQPLIWRSAKCHALDGSCKVVGSMPFPCRDENGLEKSNCQCIDSAGQATLVIDS